MEARLQVLLPKVKVDGFALPEGWGLAGSHRTDLAFYLRERKIVHFEIFGSVSTVHRDVNILLMSDADVKVAILMDRDADPKVATEYFRVVPDNRFEWAWISEFLDEFCETRAIEHLARWIDEAVSVGGPLDVHGASIRLVPDTGPPFSKFQVIATGFHPSNVFSTFWDPEETTVLLAHESELDATGSGETMLFVPHGGIAGIGRHTLRSVDTLGNSAAASFTVAPAWPTPSLRAVPNIASRGSIVKIVGGGAPSNAVLDLLLWTGHSGYGIARFSAGPQGEFSSDVEVPWLLGSMQLVSPGRHKLTVSRHDNGAPFNTYSFLEVLPTATPSTIEWHLSSSHTAWDLTTSECSFLIENDILAIQFRLRNGRNNAIYFQPNVQLTLLQVQPDKSLKEVTHRELPFELLSFELSSPVPPASETQIKLKFRRDFPGLDSSVVPSMKSLKLHMPCLVENEGLLDHFEIWSFPMQLWEIEN